MIYGTHRALNPWLCGATFRNICICGFFNWEIFTILSMWNQLTRTNLLRYFRKVTERLNIFVVPQVIHTVLYLSTCIHNNYWSVSICWMGVSSYEYVKVSKPPQDWKLKYFTEILPSHIFSAIYVIYFKLIETVHDVVLKKRFCLVINASGGEFFLNTFQTQMIYIK